MNKNLKTFLFLHIGPLFVAIHVHFFLSPNSLATGGVSGLSIILNDVVPNLSIGVWMLIVNLVLFVIGFLLLGFAFGAKTIYASVMLSVMVWLLEWLFPLSGPLSEDILIQLIIGQCIAALGIALVFNQRASTGGTDIIALILNKYLSIDMGRGVLLADILIALSSILVFGPEVGMYAVFGVILNGLVIDYTLQQVNEMREVVIISSESELIRSYIVGELKQGATIHFAKGAFTSDEKEVITTILNKKDFIRLKKYISATDKQAFITVHNMREILGQNYTQLA
ncbi:YitT family protein [Sutcliffiella deserti]|uniref:YitT family protein n=1 Tax=Sutcliffiella deserti TaxID=2875501 RepID=UPI001CBD8895|nr:YitT family protein [Sutcliffiella deserti]